MNHRVIEHSNLRKPWSCGNPGWLVTQNGGVMGYHGNVMGYIDINIYIYTCVWPTMEMKLQSNGARNTQVFFVA